MRGGMRDEHEARVVRHVEPFVRVGRPRVGTLDAARVVPQLVADAPPTARTRRRRAATRRAARAIAAISSSGSKAPVFTLPACAQTIAGPVPARSAASRASGRIRPCSSASARTIWRVADPEQPQRAEHRHVHFAADHDAQRRRSVQAVRFDVPSGAPQHLVARRRQRREVRHVAAGDEADAGARRQAEQLQQPRAGDLFDDRRRRRQHVQAGGLIPDRRHPFRRQRRRQRAAGDEAEIARPGRRDDARIGCADQLARSHDRAPSDRPAAGRRTPCAARRSSPPDTPAGVRSRLEKGARGIDGLRQRAIVASLIARAPQRPLQPRHDRAASPRGSRACPGATRIRRLRRSLRARAGD